MNLDDDYGYKQLIEEFRKKSPEERAYIVLTVLMRMEDTKETKVLRNYWMSQVCDNPAYNIALEKIFNEIMDSHCENA